MAKNYSQFYSVHVTSCYVNEDNVHINAVIMYKKKMHYLKFCIAGPALIMGDYILSFSAYDVFEEILNVTDDTDGAIKALALASWLLYENRLGITRSINKMEV